MIFAIIEMPSLRRIELHLLKPTFHMGEFETASTEFEP
jgi:hypothetical protein